MNHPFNLNSLSPFKNANEDDSSSEDDSKDNYNYIDDLYDQIGAPIPLPEEKKPSSSDVRTGCKIHFVKLPETMYQRSNAEIGSPNGIDKMIDDVSVSLQSGADDSKAIRAGISMAPQSLYGLYPRNDPRLVYLKYKDQGDWEEKRKYYASYLINLVNLINNNAGIVQYQGVTLENNNGSIVKNTVTSLRFDAMFESGNLFAAFKVSEYEYDLILQNDINTRGNTQWFFFAVSNTLKGRTVKFNIVNLLKPDSLFNEGMKPAVFSNLENALKGEGWKRAGISASYYKNNISKEGMGNKTYYTLSFSYTFKHSDDTVYFAHSFPYTYSNLKEYLAQLCEDPVRKSYIVRKTLCLTLAKNECEYLSITSPYHLENIDKRCGIIVTARQHPGESLSSYMMEGFINFITSEEPEAQLLRKHCVFKIVPMLNPDGVIHGNYRTSLSGRDLNRIWNKPSPVLHPTIYYTKELIRRVAARRRLRLVCDLHGHSRKNNAFFYGNATEDNPYNPRVFPLVLSKISKYVSFEDSRFVIQKAKENTARIALWKELRIDNIFTLEASFYGYQQDGIVKHFTQEDYRNLGIDLARAAFIYLKDITLDIFTTPDPKSRVEDKKAEEKPCEPPSKKQTDKDKKQFRRRRSLSMTNNADDIMNNNTTSKPAPFDKPLSPLRRNDSINCNSLVEELKSNRQLIAVGNNEGDSGSDTDNSEDEIPDKELNKVVPLKNVSRPKKKKRDMVKKKSTSIAPTRRDDKKEEEKEKPVPPTKVDSSTNTAPSQARADKNQAFVIKPKLPLRKMMRPPHLREKVFIAEPTQETAGPVEMVSKGCQTEETWYYYMSEDQGTSLDRQLGHQNKSFDLPMESKGVSCPNVGQRRHKGSSNSSRSMKNKDAFMIVGEKTGIDSSSGIDVNYKLGRNQISRAVLAKFAPVFFGPEARRERMGLLGQAKRAEAARNEIVEHMARKPPAITTQKVEGGLSRNVTPVGQAPYFLSFKEGDPKINSLQDESTRETNIAMPRFEDARPRNRREIAHVRTGTKETKDSAEKRSISIKELSGECQTPRLNGVSQKRRATMKDKPPVPLPSLFRMHHGKSDLKEIATKEALATDISSFINNSRKAGSTEDTEEDSFVKGKLSKTPSNIGLVSHMSSYRDLVETSNTKRDKNLLGPIKEYPVAAVAGGIFQIPSKFVVKEQAKGNQRREKSNKPERLLLNDIKTDIEKKLGELDIASPKGRRSQNSNLRKI